MRQKLLKITIINLLAISVLVSLGGAKGSGCSQKEARDKMGVAWTPSEEVTAGSSGTTLSQTQKHLPIYISNDDEFNTAHGVVAGSGTPEDPYIIQGWDIDASQGNQAGIEIKNVSADFIIRECYIHNGGTSKDGINLRGLKGKGKVEDCAIENNYFGIKVNASPLATIKPNNNLAANHKNNMNQEAQWRMHPRFIKDEIIIKLTPGVSINKVVAVGKQLTLDLITGQHNVQIQGTRKLFPEPICQRFNDSGLDRIYIITLCLPADIAQDKDKIEETIEKMVQRYKNDPNIEYIEPNHVAYPCFTPDDPDFPQQYQLSDMECGAAWDITRGDNVIITNLEGGVIGGDFRPWINDAEDINGDGNFDTMDIDGIDNDGNGYIDDGIGWNFSSGNNQPTASPHGVTTLSIAAACINNGMGMAGVCNARTMGIIRGGYPDENGQYACAANMAAAFYYAAYNGAHVINTSFGWAYGEASIDDPCNLAHQAVKDVHQAGVIICSASGNEGANMDYFRFVPACFPEVIAVTGGGKNGDGTWTCVYNYGHKIDVIASCTSVLGGMGTSFAAPYITGLAGLIKDKCLELGLDWGPEEIRRVIRASANDVNEPGFDIKTGYGSPNAYAALQIVLNGTPPAGNLKLFLPQGSVLYGNAAITGKVDGNCTIIVEVGQSLATLTQVSSGPPASDQILGYWDTTAFPDGNYILRVSSYDSTYGYKEEKILNVVVRQVKKWTYMGYIVADDELEASFMNEFSVLCSVGGSSNDVNLIAQVDRIEGYDTREGDWSTTKRFYLDTLTNELEDLGECNMGDPAVLVDFVKWAIDNYPAEHYALIFVDHGRAWVGVSFDTTDQDGLTIPELKTAFHQIRDYLGRPIDLVGYSACIMANQEAIYAHKGTVAYTVGTETAPNSGMWAKTDWLGVLNDLKVNPDMSPEALAILHAQKVSGLCEELSALKHSSQDYPLTESLNNLAQKLRHVAGTHHSEIMAAATQSGFHAPFYYLLDLLWLANNLKTQVPDAGVQDAAQKVIDDLATVVLYNHDPDTDLLTNGLSIAFFYDPSLEVPFHPNPRPGSPNIYDFEAYKGITFLRETNWDEFQEAFLEGIDYPNPDGEPTCQIDPALNGNIFYSSSINISGTASNDATRVELKLDQEDWVEAEIVEPGVWAGRIDPSTLPRGMQVATHKIYARSYDGLDYSITWPSITITIQPPDESSPDLIINSLNSSNVSPSGELTITATLRNMGTIDNAANIKVGFYLNDPSYGGTLIGESTIDLLVPYGDEATPQWKEATCNLTWNIQALPIGAYELYVKADYPNEIAELNENNNSKTVPLVITNYAVELICATGSLNISSAATITYTAEVNNKGSFPDTINLSVSNPDPANWGASLSVEQVYLDPGSSQEIEVLITAFSSTTTGDNATMDVTATSLNNPDKTDTISLTTTVVETLEGDVDRDGDVDIFDVVLVGSVYGSLKDEDPDTPGDQPSPNWDERADLDKDGDVDIFDVVAVSSHYGETLNQ